MDLAPGSPDWDPIENLLKIIARDIYAVEGQFENREQFQRELLI